MFLHAQPIHVYLQVRVCSHYTEYYKTSIDLCTLVVLPFIWMSTRWRAHACFIFQCCRDTGMKVNIIKHQNCFSYRAHARFSFLIAGPWLLSRQCGDFLWTSSLPMWHSMSNLLGSKCNGIEFQQPLRNLHAFCRYQLNRVKLLLASIQRHILSEIHSAQLHCVFYSMARKISNYSWFYGLWFLTSWYADTFS